MHLFQIDLHYLHRHCWALCPMEIIVAVTALNAITPLKSHTLVIHTQAKGFPLNVWLSPLPLVIYMLPCPCGLSYVGKTTRKLKQRISEHKSAIRRNDPDYPVAVHFNEHKHDVSSLRFYGVERVAKPHHGGDHDVLLQRHEAFWISTSHCLLKVLMMSCYSMRCCK